jgi:3-deoxy-D-manno-octulosonate 8-phosphate phosphatase (KDO 8-P phosphatase)
MAARKDKEVEKSPAEVKRRAKKIRVLLMDVDGTLTNGDVCLLSMPDGSAEELKIFNAHDGAGLVLAHIMGIKTGLITGRKSAAMERRARDMKMDYVFQGQPKKVAAYEEILRETGVTDEEVAYVGDDLPDLPLLGRAGLAVAVGNAVEEVKRAAHYVTARDGGNGALREVVELILKAQERWKDAVPRALA